MRRRWFLALGLACASPGCAAGGDPSSSGPPRFDGEPLERLSTASGRWTVTVRSWPQPPVKGVNTVQYRVADEGGLPVEGVGITATPWMPAHGHGTSVQPSVEAQGGGVYQLDQVLFFMEGRWELRCRLEAASWSEPLVAAFDVR